MESLKNIQSILFEEYLQEIQDIPKHFYALQDAEISTEDFSFYTSVSSVFSSKIEGEEIHLDSFIKYKKYHIDFQFDYTKKVGDLYDAYIFAQNNSLNERNVLQAHCILTRNILSKTQQGVYRTGNMVVITEEGRIEYVAASPFCLKEEMSSFFNQLNELLKQEMTVEQSFFYASLLHLMFVKIHPMNDGNGRLARLLEKWFLAQKLGDKAWFVSSEKYYYENHQAYYHNLRRLGLEYENLDFAQANPFLMMLARAVVSQ